MKQDEKFIECMTDKIYATILIDVSIRIVKKNLSKQDWDDNSNELIDQICGSLLDEGMFK